jgi:hypothetical protein
MALSRCKAFDLDNSRCGLTAEHPGVTHSFGPTPPGPPSPPPRKDAGEYYALSRYCMACASDVHSKCSGPMYCECAHD